VCIRSADLCRHMIHRANDDIERVNNIVLNCRKYENLLIHKYMQSPQHRPHFKPFTLVTSEKMYSRETGRLAYANLREAYDPQFHIFVITICDYIFSRKNKTLWTSG